MSEPPSSTPQERLQEALYKVSYKRLKKRGLSDASASRVAAEVAQRASVRTKAPEFGSPDEFAAAVYAICRSLGEGQSYYELIGERPYLVTSRIDRLVAAATRVRPDVPLDLALAAKQATTLERLSGSLAILFTAIALGAVGFWYALAIGLFVSIGSEVYVQTGMPAPARRAAARYHLSRWSGLAALVVLMLAGYSWLKGAEQVVLKGLMLAGFAIVAGAVVPGLVLAILVGSRERKWRSEFERLLVQKEPPEEPEDR